MELENTYVCFLCEEEFSIGGAEWEYDDVQYCPFCGEKIVREMDLEKMNYFENNDE